MDPKRSDEEIVHAAVDALLLVVTKSADDLRAFHDAVEKLRAERRTPFPRAAVATTESIIEHLTSVEEKLREMTIALGL
jgi:hypothetical protein